MSDALALVNPPDKARELFGRYREAFSAGFQEAYSPAVAAGDIRVIEGLSEQRPLGVDFHHRLEEEQRAVGLKVWSWQRPLPLSERVPVLENMGFRVVDERTYHIEPKSESKSESKGEDEHDAWFHDMLLERRDGGMIDLDAGKARLEAAFLMVMRGGAENDGYNALTLAGGLAWRDVALIRTLSRFLRQVRVPYSQDYMWATLVKHFRHRRRHRRTVPRPLRSAPRGRARARRQAERNRRAHRRGIAEGREPGRGPHPAPLRQRGAVGDPHQFLSRPTRTASPRR